jgi:hypothetical protein
LPDLLRDIIFARMKNALLILSAFFLFTLTIDAATAETVRCRSMKEEPGDPMPVRVLELKRNGDRYALSFTPNLEKQPLQGIHSTFQCRFFKASETFPSARAECVAELN